MHKNIEVRNVETGAHEIVEVETESEFNNLWHYPYTGTGASFNSYPWVND
ncbi:hypothetical protein LB941_06320 [Ligilactobacillus sp. WILCCON 0076]|uniref:Uncharacterized protein n=1 Tax=Ligilactobacillus ubinensis TaxID=2876789 RepID=A0A9X2JLF0_9LACO|nr:hypothetical protein [Ligilactobacillus ubinensis]MCP0886947.1 hypothetical protein [Ligilactobacillus ubinensis]